MVKSFQQVRDIVYNKYPTLDLTFLVEACDEEILVKLFKSDIEETGGEDEEIPDNPKSLNDSD